VKLFIVYLGGKLAEGRVGEDHEVVAVAAEEPVEARKKAKAKWRGVGDPHVDAVVEYLVVDGHQVTLTPVDSADVAQAETDWAKLNALDEPDKCGRPIGLSRSCRMPFGHLGRCE
jgi:hypothetical protein